MTPRRMDDALAAAAGIAAALAMIDEPPDLQRLDPEELEMLVCLAEEASEIVQAVTKLLRHGADSYHPDHPDGPTNLEALHREIGDFSHVVETLVGRGLLTRLDIEKAQAKKGVTICKYLHGGLLG